MHIQQILLFDTEGIIMLVCTYMSMSTWTCAEKSVTDNDVTDVHSSQISTTHCVELCAEWADWLTSSSQEDGSKQNAKEDDKDEKEMESMMKKLQ